MAIFGKKTDDQDVPQAASDPRKAKRFFDHARAVTDGRNYDYAIDCYINGLRFELDNMTAHEALREVSLKRKLAGGKSAGLAEKLKKMGKGTVDRLLHAELLLAKDPLNISHQVELMAYAVEVQLPELALWIGGVVLDTGRSNKKPSKAVYIKARDLFAKLGAFGKAVEACRLAVDLDPENRTLLSELKDFEAERTMQEAGYSESAGKEGGFRNLVKDMAHQQRLEHEDAITKTASAVDEEIERRRIECEEDPQDTDRLLKLASALVQKETDEAEKEAVKLFKTVLDQTGQYRYKMRVGDIQMKQMNRWLRQIKAKLKNNPNDVAAKKQYQQLLQRKLRFELEEYNERVKNYPTDLGLRFELGKRLFAARKHDEAIGAFQQAKADPKHRIVSLDYLGRCYAAQGWYEEAVDTLRQAIDAYPVTEDPLAMELRYQLMLSLKELAIKNKSVEQAQEAQKIASRVLQTDINYRDIRKQMESVRELVNQLEKKG